MSQESPKGYIDADTGALHVTRENDVAGAYLTSHSGASRPSYAEAGTIWLDTTATPWILKQYDGTDDITLGTVNASTDLFQAADALKAGGLTVGNASGNVPVSNGTLNNNLHAQIMDGVRRKIVNIGNWNMDTVSSLSIAHGLTLANIRTVLVMIRNDADDRYYPLDYGVSGTPDGFWSVDATNVDMSRLGSGTFDAAGFATTGGYNRGYIVIEYTV